MVGFGSMMVASHRGLASLGLVLAVGVGSCLFVALVALPAVLTLCSSRPAEAQISPPRGAIDTAVAPLVLPLPRRIGRSESLAGRRAAS
jgi:hypothetical protein